MSYEVKFRRMLRVYKGVAQATTLGLGSDGTLWVNPRELGISGRDLENMNSYPGDGPLAMVDRETSCVYVNAQALAATQADPALRQALAATIKMLVGMVQGRTSDHDSSRDN